MQVDVVDIRPLDTPIPGLRFIRADATELACMQDQSVISLSSLHAVEHIGLGRYGDTVDPDGWRKACASLQRVLAPGGHLYFSVPVGRERVMMNAHRIFNPPTIISAFPELRLWSFALIDDAGKLHDPAATCDAEWLEYGCGLFEFVRAV